MKMLKKGIDAKKAKTVKIVCNNCNAVHIITYGDLHYCTSSHSFYAICKWCEEDIHLSESTFNKIYSYVF